MEKQLSELRNAFSHKTNHFPPLHHHQTSQPPHSGPPHPAMLPQPQFSPSPTVNNSVQSPPRAYSHEDMSKIRDMVHVAKFSVGFGPITSDNIRSFNDQNQAIAIRMAAVDFLRKKLGISEHEIREEDIVNTFLPDDLNIPRIYVEFSSHDQADFCLDLFRSLRNPLLKVVKYIPREFRTRNRAIEYEAYILRKHTVPPFKTRIDFEEDDLVLTKCRLNHHRYTIHTATDLPPIDLAPQRPPPPARTTKRNRSEDLESPNNTDKKKERTASPPKTTTDNLVPEVVITPADSGVGSGTISKGGHQLLN